MHSKGLVQTMTWMLVLATVAAMTPATLASTGNDSTRERDQQSAGQDAITRSPEPLRPTVALTLDAPPVAAPGEIVTATLVLENAGSSQEPISAVTTSALPRGVEFVAAEVGVIWDSYLNTVYWEVESLVPGETAVAQFSVRVTAVGPAVYVTLTAGAQASAVAELITDEARVQILPSQAAQTHLDPGRPGELRVDGGRFRAAVDGAGNPHGVTLTHRWQQPQPGQFYAFDFTLDRTAPVTAPLTITLHYNPSDLSSAPPAQLTFRRLDPGEMGEDRWQALPTDVNPADQTLTTAVIEGGTFSVTTGDEENYLKGILTPAVEGLTTNLWTGDSAFSYPLSIPPAAGGAMPGLALTYSSGEANGMLEVDLSRRPAQAGPFGLGWNLQGGGVITRDKDGHYVLEFAGGGFQLVDASVPGDPQRLEDRAGELSPDSTQQDLCGSGGL